MINHYTYIRNNINDCTSMYKLPFVIGLNKDELPIYQDLAKVHNLLIIGRRLSGKTAFVNNILKDIISHISCRQYQLVIITQDKLNYQQLLSPKNIVTDNINSLYNIITEAKLREQIFQEKGTYPVSNDQNNPYIIIAIDDLTEFIADSKQPNVLLEQVTYIANLSKNIGIHFICTATEHYKTKIPDYLFNKFVKRYFIDNPAANDIGNFIPIEQLLSSTDLTDPKLLFKIIQANREPIIAQRLIEEGFDVNKPDELGNPPITYAQTLAMAKCLFYNGANLNTVNTENVANKDVLQFIIEHSDT